MQRRRGVSSGSEESAENKTVRRMVRQVERSVEKKAEPESELKGNDELMISTGSTLLDLAISGGRKRGGGIPGGIMVEMFGPHSSGKTMMLCEIAGDVQRKNGAVSFHDPEARLNLEFAKLFGLRSEEIEYSRPDTIHELFAAIREWKPSGSGAVNGVFADSLAALSTEMEMKDEDKMGARRAKEFSEECRKTCRMIEDRNILLVCSNQIRETIGEMFGPKTKSPGGQAIGFYSSLRLKFNYPKKIVAEKTLKSSDVKVKKTIGTITEVEVFKNSLWQGYHSAEVYFLFDYGIDDIRANLDFVKTNTKDSVYRVDGEKVGQSLERSIAVVENDRLELKLKEQVIDLWEEIEAQFSPNRSAKRR